MYIANEKRYENMTYNRLGKSGLLLPAVSLGLWHNFGDNASYDSMKELLFTAFDNGITHFDIANNYGPPYGSAEKNAGRLLRDNFSAYRDELIISTKTVLCDDHRQVITAVNLAHRCTETIRVNLPSKLGTKQVWIWISLIDTGFTASTLLI